MLCISYCGCFNLFCNVWVCVCVGFVMCRCFGDMCTCIYCVLCCFYCVFVLFRLWVFILICFVCTVVRTAATEWQLNCSSSRSSSNNNNNNNIGSRNSLRYTPPHTHTHTHTHRTSSILEQRPSLKEWSQNRRNKTSLKEYCSQSSSSCLISTQNEHTVSVTLIRTSSCVACISEISVFYSWGQIFGLRVLHIDCETW